MLSIIAFGRATLFLHAAKATFVPEYQSLLWKYEGENYWAPLNLKTQSFALETPTGAAPDALNKRYSEFGNGQYQACTVLTLDGIVTAAALDTKLSEYQAIGDDVWSPEQVSLAMIIVYIY